MSGKKEELDILLNRRREIIDREIARVLQEEPLIPDALKKSMSYSLEAGGKRLRPFLCMAGMELAGYPAISALPMAVSLEMFHTASLIHDDLPCMDDDSMRRGKASNHVIFGEGMALLAGDSLLLWAFEHALRGLSPLFPPERVLKAVRVFAKAVGPTGVCAGQVLDTTPSSREKDPDFTWRIAALKTGTLIRASVLTGGILGGLPTDREEALYNYGTHIGTAFQVVDDLLDKTGTAQSLGKTPGKDFAQGKLTFVSAYGLEKARSIAFEESRQAVQALSCFGEEAETLRSLALFLVERSS